MKRPAIWLFGAILAAGLCGCGRSDQSTSAYNEVLGGSTAGAPAAPAALDAGLLKDQSTYQPAAFTALPGSAAVGGAGGGGVEETAIREAFRKSISGTLAGNIDDALSLYDPASIAPLLEKKSALIDTVFNLQTTWKLVEAKLAPDLKTGAAAVLNMLNTQAPEIYVSALKVEVLSPTEASVSIDPAAMMQALQGPMMQLTASLGQASPGGAPPATPQTPAGTSGDVVSDGGSGDGGFRTPPSTPPADVAPTPTGDGTAPPAPGGLPGGMSPEMLAAMASQSGASQSIALRKVNDAWRVVLPRPMTTAEGELVGEGLQLLNEMLNAVSDKVSTVEQITQQDLMPLLQSLQMQFAPRLMEFAMKAQALQQAAPQAGDAPKPDGDG